ncbi:MAG: LCP family protein [Brooklawnia sp.]|jgi:LCP family protein required for cell wall assembly
MTNEKPEAGEQPQGVPDEPVGENQATESSSSSNPSSDEEYFLPEQQETVQAGKKRRRKNRVALGLVGGVLGLILLVVAVIAGLYAKTANDAMNQVQRQPMLPQGERPPAPDPDEGEPPVNVLIMGTDSRGADDQGRSDVLMMAHLTGDRKTAYLISFPRDMWVDVPGHGMAKINAAYAWGGMPLTVQTVEQLTGTHISHSAVVDFEGFVQAIDAVGGVEVYNHVASSAGDQYFPEGIIHLDGQSGLTFSRQRYNLPNGDLDRARRQREVVLAVVQKMMTREVFADPGKLNEVLTTMAPHFTVNEELTNAEMTSLALSMRITGSDGLRQLQAPIASFGTSADGQSIDIVHEEFMADLGAALQDDEMETYWQAHRHDPPVRER